MLRQDLANKSPQHVANQKCPHAAVGLVQGYEASDPETLKYDGRDGGVGKPTGGAIQQARVLLVVQEDAEVLISSARRASGGAAPGAPEAIEKKLLGEGARLVGSEVQHGVSQGRVRHGRSSRRVYRRCRARAAQQ